MSQSKPPGVVSKIVSVTSCYFSSILCTFVMMYWFKELLVVGV